MKFFKLLRFDIIQGIIKRSYHFIIIIGFLIISCLDFYVQINTFELSEYTYGDFLMYIFGGMREYIPSPSDPFPIPFRWLLWHFLVLYFTLHYMHDDLTGFGQNLILRCQSRTKWWLSKCLWNITYVALFYLIGWLITFLIASFCGANPSFEILSSAEILEFGEGEIIGADENLWIEMTILPLLILISVSLIQMTMSLVIKPLISYIISAVIYISSAYKLTPFLLGNYAMAIRSDLITENGVGKAMGIILSCMISLLSIMIGVFIFRRYSILNSKEAS